MPDPTLLYLIVNDAFILAGAIVAMLRQSNCSKFICGSCLEIDNVSHNPETSVQFPQTEISQVGIPIRPPPPQQ